MATNERLQSNYLAPAAALTLNGVAVDTVTACSTLAMFQVTSGTLSAQATVDAETNGITIELGWQVSADGTTWMECSDMNNGGRTVLATGTGGADPAVTRVIEAPRSVYGYGYCRAFVTNRVQIGTVNDTYRVGYSFEMDDLAGSAVQ